MAGLVRYIILPICLWWLITGGYEVFLPEDSNRPRADDSRPEQPQSKSEPSVLIANTEPKVPPAIKIAPLNDKSANQSKAVSKSPPKRLDSDCHAKKNSLLRAERDGLIIDLNQLNQGLKCELSNSQKLSLLKHSTRQYVSNQMQANALEVIALYQETFPSDPEAYFWESQVQQEIGAANQAVTAFVKGYRLSEDKKQIAPRHFLVALKSMQSLQLFCEQINVMRAMTILEQLDENAKTMIAQQIQTLETQCNQ